MGRPRGDPPQHRLPLPPADVVDSPGIEEHSFDSVTRLFKAIALQSGMTLESPPWMTFTVEDASTPFCRAVEKHGRRYEADFHRENLHRPTFWHLYQAACPASTPEAAIADSLNRFWPL